MREIWMITLKNVKFRFRDIEQFSFMFGFPAMFVFIFWIMFRNLPFGVDSEFSMFDVFIWGLIGFTTAFAAQSASVAFSQEKERTLKRLLTTPVGGTHAIFTGFILSEVLIIVIQLLIVYTLAFLVLGVYFASIGALVINLGMYLLLALVCIGIGLILAATLSPKLAGQIPMIVILPIVFLSGSFVPINSPIIYGNPVFWARQFAIDIGLWGKGFGATIELTDYMSSGIIETGIAVGWSIPIMIGFATAFLLLGLLLFKKTLQE